VPGYRFVFADLGESPYWLTNVLLWFGCSALMTHRWLAAGLAGLIAIGLALFASLTNPLIWDSLSLAGQQAFLASLVLLTGGGFYGWWRARREARAKDIKPTLPEIPPPTPNSARDSGPPGARSRPPTQEEDRGRPIATAAGGWQPWPLLVLIIGLYGASLFAPTVSIGGGVISYGAGYQFVFGDLKTFLLLFGSWSLMTRRWLAAGIAGLIATGWTLYGALRHAHWASIPFFDLPGYQMSFTSVVLLAGVGFYGWWRSRCEARAGDVRTTLPEVGPPKPDPTRDLDGP
jgi:hypothetical protein